MSEPCDLTALEARRLIGRRALSPVELLESCLRRIGEVNHAVNAMVAMDEPAARAAARAAEAAVMKGEPLGLLHGLPVGIKDLEETKGLRTTYGSPIFADFVPDADCGMVANLRRAGAVVIGKTNTPEFGAGANTRNAVYGVTGNPFDPAKSAAGSSGGSGVALACGMAPICSGSDTGGSLRNPAAFNGIVGFRPSPGVVPSEKRGHGWSGLPVLGPMARTVADTALMFAAMASDDASDPLAYTLHGEAVRGVPGRYHPLQPVDLASLRLAVSVDFGQAPVEKHIREVFAGRAQAVARLFGAAEEADPDCRGGDEAFEVLRAMLFLAAHAQKVRERPQDVGPNVRANVEEGLRYTLEDAARAAAAQTRLYRAWQHFFARHDVLITPAITVSPRPWKELYPAEIDGKPTRTYFHWLACAYYPTLAGHPAISLPMGLDRLGMPFGLQIVGPRGGDALVLRVAAAIEEAFAHDPVLRRPVPDLAALRAAPPIKAMPGAVGWD
ncbi:amidase [Roseomonas alkaliterrae]|uniref:Asp-tRNA(Asn)/Glu-tRNA(Gln) amidotransferase A subunit family amidase n=1 Tax=Neoroseomonas alkaliterrae TaxID=1452450 RepID=A0A840Y813_9PROT|nr:amidase family protein [Neoroseomonas alkaliterrae]MBB5690004.1 Asp-tRNA(Asn)/Glu-tRNA(Gln) amidotransferase A subunit family amidase [Neoroseomonas alkaliterrae]MBR0675518.1 amidase [Neoroseomonas alkaliterrae]